MEREIHSDPQANAVLEEIRGHSFIGTIIDESEYRGLLVKKGICALAGLLDWDYKYVSFKLYMVLHTRCGIDSIKVSRNLPTIAG